MNILILDDDPDALELLVSALTDLGHRTQAFVRSSGLLRALSTSTADAVVCDFRLSRADGDGFAVLARVRDLAPDARRVLVSADIEPKRLARELAAGLVDAFVAKPCAELALATALG